MFKAHVAIMCDLKKCSDGHSITKCTCTRMLFCCLSYVAIVGWYRYKYGLKTNGNFTTGSMTHFLPLSLLEHKGSRQTCIFKFDMCLKMACIRKTLRDATLIRNISGSYTCNVNFILGSLCTRLSTNVYCFLLYRLNSTI